MGGVFVLFQTIGSSEFFNIFVTFILPNFMGNLLSELFIVFSY